MWKTVIRRARGWMLLLPVDVVAIALPMLWRPELLKALGLMVVLSVLTLAGDRGYRAKLTLSFMDDLPVIVRNVLAPIAVIAIVVAFKHEPVSLVWFLESCLWGVVLLLVGRCLTTGLIGWSRRRGLTSHRAVVLGGNAVAVELVETLSERPQHGLQLVGYVAGQDMVLESDLPRVGEVGELAQVVASLDVEVVVIADGGSSDREVLLALEDPRMRSCDIYVVPKLSYMRTQSGYYDHISSIPVMRIGQTTLDGPAMLAKRFFDVMVAGALLTLLSPVLLLLALGVRRSGPQILFRQQRVGRDGVVFECLKLRSMRPAVAEEMATTWSGSEGHRMTGLGRVMRKLSLDELPQLWNVIRGDMSLVGPRPERPFFVEQFTLRYDVYRRRHRVRSGLTGLAQVSGLRGDTSIGMRARYDNYYIENWTLWLDTKILLRTVGEVLFARGE
ncbi:sugar transferase [Lapillicoccus sp.]|uniref:sugar transferase n=1 Tax=Lapillicoccus sp. TaxID=1909287 RepID=UPI0025EBB705|nr:sugar transferase [Lapillicoccus sp.]